MTWRFPLILVVPDSEDKIDLPEAGRSAPSETMVCKKCKVLILMVDKAEHDHWHETWHR